MHQEKLKKAIVIHTTILGRKNYIAGTSMRPDNSLIPFHHNDVNQAKAFSKQSEAIVFLSRIVNHYNRDYVIAAAMVPASNLKPVKLQPREKVLA